MAHRDEITICLGSSCFSRGNDKNLEIIKGFLKEHDLKDVVSFKGHLCDEKCNQGPVLQINGTEYTNVTKENIISLLNRHFLK